MKWHKAGRGCYTAQSGNPHQRYTLTKRPRSEIWDLTIDNHATRTSQSEVFAFMKDAKRYVAIREGEI